MLFNRDSHLCFYHLLSFGYQGVVESLVDSTVATILRCTERMVSPTRCSKSIAQPLHISNLLNFSILTCQDSTMLRWSSWMLECPMCASWEQIQMTQSYSSWCRSCRGVLLASVAYYARNHGWRLVNRWYFQEVPHLISNQSWRQLS